MTIPGVAGTPAPDSRLLEGAHESGRLAVEMVAPSGGPAPGDHPGVVPQRHRRARRDRRVDERGRAPAGHRRSARGSTSAWRTSTGSGAGCRCWSTCSRPAPYLMEDLFRAGGLLAVLAQVPDLLDPTAVTVTGGTLVEAISTDPGLGPGRHRPAGEAAAARRRHRRAARQPGARGAIVKPAAASPELLMHRGPAVVFDSVEDLHARIDDPDLPVTPDSVLVLRGCGPKGYPGMPEVANLPLPRRCSSRACATWCGSATAG